MKQIQQPSDSRHTAPEGGRLGLMTIDQVARELGISKDRLYSLTCKKLIPHYKPTGGRVFFVASEVLEWVKSHKVKADTELEALADGMEAKRKSKRPRTKSVGSNLASA